MLVRRVITNEWYFSEIHSKRCKLQCNSILLLHAQFITLDIRPTYVLTDSQNVNAFICYIGFICKQSIFLVMCVPSILESKLASNVCLDDNWLCVLNKCHCFYQVLNQLRNKWQFCCYNFARKKRRNKAMREKDRI